jgi:class 3 adenylate cyclase
VATEQIDNVQVAVLFCDLRGFTALSEGMDPRLLVTELNAYFDAMVNVIHEHGGSVGKFIGDAMMAVFGGLAPVENPSASAFDAAVAMETRLQTLNEQRVSRGLPAWEHGVGIHFGEVVQGPLGSKDRKDFTVIGDTVNTASRLESATRTLGRAIVLSDACFERLSLDRQQRCEGFGHIALKGKTQTVLVYGTGPSVQDSPSGR